MPDDPEPFQLDFAIPEIGAEVGDWLCSVNDPAAPLRVVRAVDRDRVRRLVSRHPGLDRAFRFLARLVPSDSLPPEPAARPRIFRLK